MNIAAADIWFLPIMAIISIVGLVGIIRGMIELHRQKGRG